MNKKLIMKYFIVCLLMTCQSVITQGQTNQSTYTHEKARLELSEIQKSLQDGASVNIKTELLEYIYKNRGHFPEITDKMSTEEKLMELLTIQSQLTQILYSLLVPSMDSVSYEHALVSISLGYVSARLMPLAKRFMKTFDKNDETYEIRINGMRQAFYGMKGMLVGYLLTTFVENKNPEITPMLIDGANSFAPDILDALPKDIKKETLSAIKETVEPRVKDDLRKQYKELVKKL